jgi:signal transduction histidine kinase
MRSLDGVNLIDSPLTRRRGLASVCLAAGFAVVLAAETWSLAVSGRAWWLDCVTGLAVCAAALLRQRWRVRAAAAGLVIAAAAAIAASVADLPGQPGVAASLALSVLVGSVVRVSPPRPAIMVACCGAVLTGMMAVLHPDIGIGPLGLWWGVAVAAGMGLRTLDASRLAALEAVRRAERLELARELHDVAAHHMTGVVLQAQAARITARKQPASLDDALADIESAGTDALAAVRRVVGLLRCRDAGSRDLCSPDGAGFAPGPEELPALVARYARRGVPVRLHLPADFSPQSWPPEVTSTVCRIVQESLVNVIRHASQAMEVTVTVEREGGGELSVEVCDDGPGGPGGSGSCGGPGGYGLVGMRERVESLGGTLSAGPRPWRGWTVRATLPAVPVPAVVAPDGT